MKQNKIIMRGIDVSHWQSTINFDMVKDAGYEFVIIKAGGNENKKRYADACFNVNYEKAVKAGLHVGAYYFAKPDYDNNVAYDVQGADDARHFMSILKGKQFDMPLYLDFEQGDKKKKVSNTIYCKAFCECIEALNCFVGIYGSDISTFHDMVRIDDLYKFSLWVARYGSLPKFVTKSMHMHQYSSKGVVPGIRGNVDMNSCYIDFPNIISKKGMNKL